MSDTTLTACPPFKPHAVLLTERTVPSQITFCGLMGGPSQFLVIPLDTNKPPVTFVSQTLAGLPDVDEGGTRYVPFFGMVQGFVVNYLQEWAVRFDLQGHPLEILQQAYAPGHVLLSIRKARFNAGSFSALLNQSTKDRGSWPKA